ncbi:hypothetical protein QYF36_021419 [Acer negundo]|nr:hypothetical protein QYF36_021419 [Acer negundo]
MVVCFGLLRRCSGLKGNPWTKRKVLCMIKPNMVQRPVQQQKLEPALRRLTYPAEDGFGRGHGGQNREDGIFTALVTTSERKKGGKSPKQVPRPRASELLCPESLANELVTPELPMAGYVDFTIISSRYYTNRDFTSSLVGSIALAKS